MQKRWSRPMRISYITQQLMAEPYRVFSLGKLAKELSVARSTISEDVGIIKEVFNRAGSAEVQTLPGATGGVRLILKPSDKQSRDVRKRLPEELSDPDRVLPGGFLYMTDIIFSSRWSESIGTYFSCLFGPLNPDYVVTVETKGIPVALMTARALDLPLILIRRDGRVSEGSSVSINYESGSSSRIQTMSLPRRAVESDRSAVIVDDFLRGGGTARGACELLAEFDVDVLSIGVVASSKEPEQKRVDDYFSLAKVSFGSNREKIEVESAAPPLD